MARRVSWGIQYDHAAVAEHILVVWLRLDLVVAFNPALERREIDAGGRLRRGDCVPVAESDPQRRPRERCDLAGMIGVIMADANIADLFGLDADLVQLVDDTHLRRHVGRGHGMT